MSLNIEKIKHMTMQEIIEVLNNSNDDNYIDKQQLLYKCIFAKEGIDYTQLFLLAPLLDEDDFSTILKYDKDYKISFLLSIAHKTYEDDLTRQAIFLLKRHGLKYIIPLLPYVDDDEIREEYIKNKH